MQSSPIQLSSSVVGPAEVEEGAGVSHELRETMKVDVVVRKKSNRNLQHQTVNSSFNGHHSIL